MKIGLHSDFTDYYDIYFSPHWDKVDMYYERFATCPQKMLGREEEFRLVDVYSRRLNIFTAEHGYTQSFKNCKVVVYTDPLKHIGEGKELMEAEEAAEKYPWYFASKYYRSDYSLRFLQIGVFAFTLRYRSDDWRSNCGNVAVELIGTAKPIISSYPMFAIDYVRADNTCYYAIDFNTAPGISPLKNILSGEEVCNQIRKFYEV